MTEAAIEELLAKQEITELLYRYCRGIDRLDWDLVRSCYHDDAFDDHSIFRGSPDEFVAFFREMLTPMTGTTHTIGNNGEWKIAHHTVVFEWTRIEPVGEQFEVPPDVVWSRRDRDDPSYSILERLVVSAGR